MAVGDPFYNYTKLVCTPAGADNSTTFTDGSFLGGSMYVSGTPKVSTGVFKFGSSSALFDGSAGYVGKTYAPGMNFGPLGSSWWVQCWFYPTAVTASGQAWLFRQPGNSSNYGAGIALVPNGGMTCYLDAPASPFGTANTITQFGWPAISLNNWHFAQFGRIGSQFYLGLDNLFASAGTNPFGNLQPATDYRMGENFTGNIAGWRVWTGFSKYGWDYDPANPFPTFRQPLNPGLLDGSAAVQRIAAFAIPPMPGLRKQADPLRVAQRLCPGQQSFAGEVDIGTTPVAGRIVRLYERASGRLVREVVTDSAGLYVFPGISDIKPYYVVALDLQPGGQNAAIADYLTPT